MYRIWRPAIEPGFGRQLLACRGEIGSRPRLHLRNGSPWECRSGFFIDGIEDLSRFGFA